MSKKMIAVIIIVIAVAAVWYVTKDNAPSIDDIAAQTESMAK